MRVTLIKTVLALTHWLTQQLSNPRSQASTALSAFAGVLANDNAVIFASVNETSFLRTLQKKLMNQLSKCFKAI